MPDIIQLIAAWKKQISLVVLISVITAAAILFIIPPKYLATATALPANPVTADKSLIFNNNIRDVYSSIGTSSELDRVVGTAQSDTIYLSVAQKFDLVSFYKIDKDIGFPLMKAARQLKEDSKVSKTEFGELMIRVWCSNKLLAPQLANAIMNELAMIHQDILNRNNQLVLKNIRDAIHLIYAGADSSAVDETKEPMSNYKKLEREYSLMINANPPALLPVEKARISDRPNKPRKLIVILATAAASFVFALWLALLLEKRKSSAK